jgi:hypothetical protein
LSCVVEPGAFETIDRPTAERGLFEHAPRAEAYTSLDSESPVCRKFF